MIIGIPKEIKIGENRIGVSPNGVHKLVKDEHTILVERGAGEGSGFSDEDYQSAGTQVLEDPTKVWKAEMVLKIKEPVERELELLYEDQIVFYYLHLASPPQEKLTRILINHRVTAIAYETVQLPNNRLVLLEPMSEISGKMAIQIAAHYLEKTYGGKGVLIGGASGVSPRNIVIIGAGTVGWNATQVAIGMGANVLVLNRGINRLTKMSETLGPLKPGNITTKILNLKNLEKALQDADVVIGAVNTPGARAPIIVSRDLVRKMQPGSVIVDVAIDQGGIFETSRPTSHKAPTYVEEGVIHYCVTNMPGAVPYTSTVTLTNATFSYASNLANQGFMDAVKQDPALAKGVNVYAGHVTNQAVANVYGLPYQPLEQFFSGSTI